MPIMKLSPVFKDYLWGGERLRALYPDQTRAMPVVAEAWLLSAHPDGVNRVANFPYAGLPLPLALRQIGRRALGRRAADIPFFPILAKLIDARDRLSVQVHPDDAYAGRVEHSFGKSEMWYILDADEDACILYDFARPCTRKEVGEAIAANQLVSLLRRCPVRKGEAYYIPAGTVHAIGAGCLIAEVQQNANLTYRVYDYGRRGRDGKLRELHIDKALDVMRTIPSAHPLIDLARQNEADFIPLPGRLICLSPYFQVAALPLGDTAQEIVVGEDSFLSLIVLSGTGELGGSAGYRPLRAGESYFIPAGTGKITLCGTGEVLLTTL